MSQNLRPTDPPIEYPHYHSQGENEIRRDKSGSNRDMYINSKSLRDILLKYNPCSISHRKREDRINYERNVCLMMCDERYKMGNSRQRECENVCIGKSQREKSESEYYKNKCNKMLDL